MGNGAERGSLFDNNRLLTAIAALAYGLGMWWLQNTWNAIQSETKARETLALTIPQTFVTKDEIRIITTARQTQIDAIIARIERNTDRLISGEESEKDLRALVSRLDADHAALRAEVEAIIRAERGEGHPAPKDFIK